MSIQLKKLANIILSTALAVALSIPGFSSVVKAASVYHVSVTGSDTANGSAESPWKTIQASVDKLTAGDTLLIHEGNYNEKIIINKSGTEGNKITIKNAPGERAVLDGTGIESLKTMIDLYDKNYIRIEGLEICNNNAKNYGSDANCGIFIEASSNGSAKGIEIVNNKIYNIDGSTWGYASNNGTKSPCHMNGHGIAVYGCGKTQQNAVLDLLIDGNEVFNNRLGQSETIVVNGNVDNFIISNNYVHDNDNIAIDVIGYEGTSSGSGDIDRARNGKVFGNAIFDCDSQGNMTYNHDGGSDGIYVDGGKSIEIYNNFISGVPYGIELASENVANGVEEIYVHDNIVTHCTDSCIIAGGTKGGKDIRIENNTLYAAESELIEIGNASTRNVTIKDNILLSIGNGWVSRKPGSGTSQIYVASGNVYYGEEEDTSIEAGSTETKTLPVVSLTSGNFTQTTSFEDKGASFDVDSKYQTHYAERLKAITKSDALYNAMNNAAVKGSSSAPLTMDKMAYNIVTDWLMTQPAVATANAVVEMKTTNNNDSGSNRTETGTSRYKGYITIGRGDDGKVNFDTINSNIASGSSETISSSSGLAFVLRTPYEVNGQTSYIVRMVRQGVVKFEPTHVGLKPIAGTNGAITPSKPYSALRGQNHTFTFTPNNGYSVDTVKLNGISVTPTGNNYTAENVTSETTIEVTFKPSDLPKTIVSVNPNHEIKLISYPETGFYNPEFSFENKSTTSETVMIYVAGYDKDSRLVDLNCVQKVVDVGLIENLKASIATNENIVKYKYFIWNSEGTPLSKDSNTLFQ